MLRAFHLGIRSSTRSYSVNRTSASLRAFASFSDATEIIMPALSPTMSHGNVHKWMLKEGDKIEAGTVMCEIETDKAVVDYEAQDDGFLAKIVLPDGTNNVEVGTTLGFLVEDEADVEGIRALEYTADAAPPAEESAAAPSAAPAASPVAGLDARASPAAGLLLASYGMRATDVVGTGKHGIVTKGDVLKQVAGKPRPTLELPPVEVAGTPQPPQAPTQQQSASSPSAPTATPVPVPTTGGEYTDKDISMIRNVIAKRLTESKTTVPHFYSSISCNIDGALNMRKTLKKDLGRAPSVNDVIIKAVALSLRDVPELNCQFQGGAVVENESIDISVAVATPNGLITPIVKSADAKGLLHITDDMRDLATRARDNKLKPEEYQGGSFTVSNLGMFGIDNFTAVINPPQAAILAIGGGKPVPRQVISPEGRPSIVFDTVMTVSLSADRRVADDEVAARFLQTFQRYMENPTFLTI